MDGEVDDEVEPFGWGAGSEVRCDRAWRERSWATSSELSFAALMARVVGMVRRAAAKAPMASCSREPWGSYISLVQSEKRELRSA